MHQGQQGAGCRKQEKKAAGSKQSAATPMVPFWLHPDDCSDLCLRHPEERKIQKLWTSRDSKGRELTHQGTSKQNTGQDGNGCLCSLVLGSARHGTGGLGNGCRHASGLLLRFRNCGHPRAAREAGSRQAASRQGQQGQQVHQGSRRSKQQEKQAAGSRRSKHLDYCADSETALQRASSHLTDPSSTHHPMYHRSEVIQPVSERASERADNSVIHPPPTNPDTTAVQ